MGAENNELTLEGLAHRLEALERENERMRSENAELRDEVSVLRDSRTPREVQAEKRGSNRSPHKEAASGFDGQVSRRGLLSKAGVAAAGLVVAGALTQRDIREAKAAQVIGDSNQEFRGGVEGTNNAQFGYGVRGRATDGWGVDGQADRAGVRGSSGTGIGVDGSGFTGVRGFGTGQIGSGRTGVEGQGDIGVHGTSSSGHASLGEGSATAEFAGVRGTGKTGVWGSTSVLGYSGVYGLHQGTQGYGLVGDGTGPGAGVLGRNAGGPGVEARDSRYGAKFAGSRAQLLLVPKGTAGRPTTGAHTKGEISMDSAAALFVCTASGTPGTWRKVTTTAA